MYLNIKKYLYTCIIYKVYIYFGKKTREETLQSAVCQCWTYQKFVHLEKCIFKGNNSYNIQVHLLHGHIFFLIIMNMYLDFYNKNSKRDKGASNIHL